jgi:hypothetical protein
MMIRYLTVILAFGLTYSLGYTQTFQKTLYSNISGSGFKGIPVVKTDLSDTISNLATQLESKIQSLSVPDGQKYRIGVFKFGDDTWKIPLSLGNPPSFLQGGLVDGLQTLLADQSNKFSVLLPDQLDQVLSTGTDDPQGLSGANLNLARQLMSAYNLQVCIFGRFLLASSTGDDVTVSAILVTATTEFEVKATISKTALGIIDNKPDQPASGRFSVRFEVKPSDTTDADLDSSWTEIPLKRKKAPTTENLYFLPVKSEYKGKRYRIKLENKGTPAIGDSSKDSDRAIGAVVFVDGISHGFKPRSTSPATYGPQTGHPLDMPKEILTKPGRYLKEDSTADDDRFAGATIEDGNFKHDKRVILGFQKGLQIAAAFRFGEPVNAAAAELLGPVSKLGTIQVFFYPEVFADDGYAAESREYSTPAGTTAGEDVPSTRFKLKVKSWFPLPAETWNIIYRYEGDPALPPPAGLETYP